MVLNSNIDRDTLMSKDYDKKKSSVMAIYSFIAAAATSSFNHLVDYLKCLSSHRLAFLQSCNA